MVRRWLPILAVGVVLAHAVSACTGGGDETDLNPQPLPPSTPPEEDDGRESESGGGVSSSSGGMSPDPTADGGLSDASDGDSGDH